MSSRNSWSDEDVTHSHGYGTEVRTDVLKLTLYDLNSSIAPRDHRLMALQAALAELDHEDEQKHDEELDLHADKIIFQKLCYAVQTNRSSEEVAMLCMALEMVYRASRARLALSFSEIRESLLPLAVDMLAKPPHIRREEAEEEEKKRQAKQLNSTDDLVTEDEYGRKLDDDYTNDDQSRFGGSRLQGNGYDPNVQSKNGARSVMSGASSAFSKRGVPAAAADSRYYDQGSVADTYDQQSVYNNSTMNGGSAASFSKGGGLVKKRGGADTATVASTQASSVYEDPSAFWSVYNYRSAANSLSKRSGFLNNKANGEEAGNYVNNYDQRSAIHSNFGQGSNMGSSFVKNAGSSFVSNDDTEDHPSFHRSAYEYDEQSEVNSVAKNGITENTANRFEESLVSDLRSHQSTIPGDTYEDEYDDQEGNYDQGGSGPTRSTGARSQDYDHDQGNTVNGPARGSVAGSRDAYYDQGSIVSNPARNTATKSQDDYADQGSIMSGPLISTITGSRHERHDHGSIVSGPVRTSNAAPRDDDYQGQDSSIVSGPGRGETPSPRDDEYDDHGSIVSGPPRKIGAGPRDDYNDQGSIVSGLVQSTRTGFRDEYKDGSIVSEPLAAESQNDYHDQGSVVSGPARIVANGSRGGSFDQGSVVSGPIRNTANGSRDDYYDQGSIVSGTREEYDDQGSIISGPAQIMGTKSQRNDYYDQVSVVTSPVKNGSRKYSYDQGSVVSGPAQNGSRGDYYDHGSIVSGAARNMESRSPYEYQDQGGTVRQNNENGSERQSTFRHDDNYSTAEGGESQLDLDEYSEVYEIDDTNIVRNSRKLYSNLETIGEVSREESSRVSSHVDARSQHAKESSSSTPKSVRAQKEAMERRQMMENRRYFKEEWEMIRTEPATHPDGVGRLLLVLRYLSRVLSAMVPMARHPGLLEALIYQLECQPYDPNVSESELAPWRIDAIATIVNLACAEENKGTILEEKGLLNMVMRVAQHDPSDEAREHAAIVFMNLAYSDENKERMVEHDGLLDTLTLLVRDDHEFTRRYATAALFTLACVTSNSERMIRHGEGEVLEVLRRVLEADPVDEARINAAEALFNIARNNNEESAQILVNHPNLLSTIADAVIDDCTADARLYCARALEWLAADLHHPMECHEMLLTALTLASQWTKTNCIAEAMKTQALIADNRIHMAQHPGLLDALGNLAMLKGYSFNDVRSSALAALELMSRDYEARIWMVQNPVIMQALTKASFEVDAEGEPLTPQDSINSNLIKDALKNLTTAM